MRGVLIGELFLQYVHALINEYVNAFPIPLFVSFHFHHIPLSLADWVFLNCSSHAFLKYITRIPVEWIPVESIPNGSNIPYWCNDRKIPGSRWKSGWPPHYLPMWPSG